MTRKDRAATTSSPQGSMSRLLAIGFLVAVSLAVYANTLPNGFVLDDESQVLRNPWIQGWRFIPDMFSKDVWSFLGGSSASNYYRPMMHVIYLVTFQLFGFKAWGFHLVNVLLHAANTALVFFVAARLTGPGGEIGSRPDRAFPAAALTVPFIAALLFATHPVHTEAVAWVASVPELSFTLCCLASFYFYLAPSRRLALSVALFALALLCKETALTLPAVLVAHDVALGKGERWVPDRLRRYAPFALVAVGYLAVRHLVLAKALVRSARGGFSPDQLILDGLPLFSSYLRALVLPTRLHFWHSFRPADSLATPGGLASLAVAAAFLAACVLAWRKHRLSFVSLALLALPLAPAFYISALPGKPFAERYLYLPSVGFVILAALGLGWLLARPAWRSAAIVILALATVLYASGTIARNAVWKDFYTLYSDTISKSPDAPVPCDDLANALFGQGKVDEAIATFEAQVAANPSNASCQSAFGSALLLKGRLEEAIEHLRLAVSLDPNLLASYNDLGIALKKTGDVQGAIEQYRKALAINPDYPDLHFSLANSLADTGDTAGALDEYRAAVRLSPENAYYRNMLGIELAKRGLRDEAIEQFQEAIRRDPNEPSYRRNLERARGLPHP